MSRIPERLPETSQVIQLGDYTLSGYSGAELRFHVPVLKEVINTLLADVNTIGHARDIFKENGIKDFRGTGIVFATDRQAGEVVASLAQKVFKPGFEPSVRVMYSFGGVVLSDYQEKGLESALLGFANIMHHAPDVLCSIVSDRESEQAYLDSGIIIAETYSPRHINYTEAPRLRRVIEYIVGQTKGKGIHINAEGVLSNLPSSYIVAGVKKGRTHFIERPID